MSSSAQKAWLTARGGQNGGHFTYFAEKCGRRRTFACLTPFFVEAG
jgi:hypothetical protein